MSRRRVAAVAVVALAVSVLAGCSRSADPGAGEARLRDVRGRVEVSRDGRTWSRRDGGILRRGDRVRAVGSTARAVLDLGRERGRLEIRGGSAVRVGEAPELTAGDLLVEPARTPLTVVSRSVRATVASGAAARLRRGLAFDAAVYEGRTSVSSAGRSLAVSALRQATVSGPGLVPTRPSPLRYRDADGWDRRFLGEAIDLGRDLEARSRGITAQLPADAGTTPGFYRLVLPGLDREPAFTGALLDATPAPSGERIVGAAIILAGRRGGFAERWRSAFSFRFEGAAWGLVALDQLVSSPASLVGTVDAALARALTPAGTVAAGGTRPRPAGAGTGTPAPGSGPGPTSPATPTTTPTTTPGLTTPTTTPPVTIPETTVPTLPPPLEPVGQLVDPLVDPLVDTVGGVVDGLLGGGQSPPP